MSTIDEQELQAYLDGELAPADVARVEAAMRADAALAARVERERRLQAQVRAAFSPVLDEPVPDRLSALLQSGASQPAAPVQAADAGNASAHPGSDKVTPIGTRRARAPRAWQAPAYALAASVAMLAVALWMRPGDVPVQLHDGQLVARGELARGLDHALASDPSADAAVAVGLSFRDADGRVCRSFVHRSARPMAGLACRQDDAWVLPVLGESPDRAGQEIRQASSEMTPEVQAAMDARLAGDVFDATQEREARDAGWR